MKLWLKFISPLLCIFVFTTCSPVVTRIETSTKISQNKTRSPKEIQTEISLHETEIKRLHRQMVNDGLTVQYGFIILRFEIMSDGSVGEVTLVRNNFGDLFAGKLVVLIKSWKFKPITSIETQLIELPYVFTEKE